MRYQGFQRLLRQEFISPPLHLRNVFLQLASLVFLSDHQGKSLKMLRIEGI